MCNTITWALDGREQELAPHETNSLFYAEDFVRYFKYQSPLSIKYCIEGEMPYVLDNQKIIVRPGSFFITNHGTEIECLPVPAGTKALIVFFTEDFIAKLAGDGLSANESAPGSSRLDFMEHVYRHPSPLSLQIQTLARHMRANVNNHPHDFQDMFFQLSHNLLAFNTHANAEIKRLNAGRHATRKELYRRLLSARDFMQDQWRAPLTLEEAARHACLSPYHFHRSFREAFGDAPMRWFRQLKMEKVRELLRKGKLTISEAALHCGFSDVFSFSKAFKRAYGTPPSTWRGV